MEKQFIEHQHYLENILEFESQFRFGLEIRPLRTG